MSFPPPLLPYSPSSPTAMEDMMTNELSDEKLGLKGSLGDLRGAKSPKKRRSKSKLQELTVQKPQINDQLNMFFFVIQSPKTIRRQRVNLGIGHHQVAHFFNGRETNCKDVIIVRIILFAVHN